MHGQILSIQNWLLAVSPGLLPLAAILFSFVNSWHCAVMCGPLVAGLEKNILLRTLLFRMIGYTTAGAAMGFFGQKLQHSLEFEVFGALGFILLSGISIFCLLPYLFKNLKFLSPHRALTALRGLAWGIMPCSLLIFLYGIAVFSRSAWLGGILLFIHALMTTPALAYTDRLLRRMGKLPSPVGLCLKWLIFALVVFNLLYFWGVVLGDSESARQRLMFCF